jgi:hypothetical protein
MTGPPQAYNCRLQWILVNCAQGTGDRDEHVPSESESVSLSLSRSRALIIIM